MAKIISDELEKELKLSIYYLDKLGEAVDKIMDFSEEFPPAEYIEAACYIGEERILEDDDFKKFMKKNTDKFLGKKKSIGHPSALFWAGGVKSRIEQRIGLSTEPVNQENYSDHIARFRGVNVIKSVVFFVSQKLSLIEEHKNEDLSFTDKERINKIIGETLATAAWFTQHTPFVEKLLEDNLGATNGRILTKLGEIREDLHKANEAAIELKELDAPSYYK